MDILSSVYSVSLEHIRLSLYLLGNVEEVEHDIHFANKLKLDLYFLMETRCMNTVNLLLSIYTENQSPETITIDEVLCFLDTHNMFVFTLTPKESYLELSSEEKSFLTLEEYHALPTHTWTLFNTPKGYLVLDSYTTKYTLRKRFIDLDKHLELCDMMTNCATSDIWFELIGVKEEINHNYEISINAYRSDLNTNTVESLFVTSQVVVNKIKKAVEIGDNCCIYLDDIMCAPLAYHSTLEEDSFYYEECLKEICSITGAK